ncbi:MAG: CehA/McbA family metallohydrolase [Thermoplasmatota archaeon]
MSWRFDGHVHSRHSKDAKGSLLELAEAAQARGLHGFAITDHDSIAGHAEIHDAQHATGVRILPSIEVTSAEGHVLAYGVHEAIPKGMSFARTQAAVEAQGGVAVLAHPLKMFSGIGPRGLDRRHQEGLVRAAEGRNGRERRIVQENTEALLAKLGIPATGGSDAHWIKDIGTSYTILPHPPADDEAWVAMIRDGLCRPGGGNLPRRKVWGHGLTVPVRNLRKQD